MNYLAISFFNGCVWPLFDRYLNLSTRLSNIQLYAILLHIITFYKYIRERRMREQNNQMTMKINESQFKFHS